MDPVIICQVRTDQPLSLREVADHAILVENGFASARLASSVSKVTVVASMVLDAWRPCILSQPLRSRWCIHLPATVPFQKMITEEIYPCKDDCNIEKPEPPFRKLVVELFYSSYSCPDNILSPVSSSFSMMLCSFGSINHIFNELIIL